MDISDTFCVTGYAGSRQRHARQKHTNQGCQAHIVLPRWKVYWNTTLYLHFCYRIGWCVPHWTGLLWDMYTIWKIKDRFIQVCNVQALLEENDLKIENIQDQGYDGAANMSGNCKRLLTRILWQNPKVLYVHWQAHCLNLVLIDTRCKIKHLFNQLFQSSWKTLCFFGQLIKTALIIYWNAEEAALPSASTGAEETVRYLVSL